MRHIAPWDYRGNLYLELKEGSMLVTAAKQDGSFNTMTAGWGGFGVV